MDTVSNVASVSCLDSINDFIKIIILLGKDRRQRRIEDLLEKTGNGDTAIVAEFSRLGWSASGDR